MRTQVLPKFEHLLDAKYYAEIRPRLLREKVATPDGYGFPLLIREAEGGKPTGRWMVLDCTPKQGACIKYWAWPPVASNNSPNAAAARMK